jgi:hypothetical protein
MKTINEKNGLSIEQLEERLEMVVGSSSSGEELSDGNEPCFGLTVGSW